MDAKGKDYGESKAAAIHQRVMMTNLDLCLRCAYVMGVPRPSTHQGTSCRCRRGLLGSCPSHLGRGLSGVESGARRESRAHELRCWPRLHFQATRYRQPRPSRATPLRCGRRLRRPAPQPRQPPTGSSPSPSTRTTHNPARRVCIPRATAPSKDSKPFSPSASTTPREEMLRGKSNVTSTT